MAEYYPLIKGLRPYSKRKDKKLLKEWFPDPNSLLPETDTCVCGKKHIVYNYVITNSKTKKSVVVGSECIKRFENNAMDVYYDAVRFATGKIKNIPKSIIARAFDEWHCINKWEYGFISDVRQKRKLSYAQDEYKREILIKIFKAMNIRGLDVPI